jgi:hypothetical protein
VSSTRKRAYSQKQRIESDKERINRRYALTDEQRTRLEPILPRRKGLVGRPAKDNRLFIEAVIVAVFLGETYLNVLGVSVWCIPVLCIGLKGNLSTKIHAVVDALGNPPPFFN